jgi:hypothetical protein
LLRRIKPDPQAQADWVKQIVEEDFIIAEVIGKRRMAGKYTRPIETYCRDKLTGDGTISLIASAEQLDQYIDTQEERIRNITAQRYQAEENIPKSRVMAGGRGGGGKQPRSNKVKQEAANFTPVNGEVFSRDKYEAWKNGKLKKRWHEMIPTMRHLGYTIDKEMKSELRDIDKKNARKFNCVEEWKKQDKDYFAEIMQYKEKKNKGNEAEDHSNDEDDRVAVAAAANVRLSRMKADMKEKNSNKNSKKKKTRKRSPSPIVSGSSESESYSDESESSDTDSTHSSESTSDSED